MEHYCLNAYELDNILTCVLHMKLVFEAKTDSHKVYHYSSGYSYYKRNGDIAIDDLYVFNSSCKSKSLSVF